MRRLTIAGTSLLVGDEAADLLAAYRATLAANSIADEVAVRALSAEGAEIALEVALGQRVALTSEACQCVHPEPDNSALVRYVRGRLRFFGLLPEDRPSYDIDDED